MNIEDIKFNKSDYPSEEKIRQIRENLDEKHKLIDKQLTITKELTNQTTI